MQRKYSSNAEKQRAYRARRDRNKQLEVENVWWRAFKTDDGRTVHRRVNDDELEQTDMETNNGIESDLYV